MRIFYKDDKKMLSIKSAIDVQPRHKESQVLNALCREIGNELPKVSKDHSSHYNPK